MSSFKIASLLFRTLSKPVANVLKQQAKSHDIFRLLCINVAQVAHRTEMTWKMRVLGYRQEKIRPLNDARAVDAGANFLGETFIFGVALSLIFAEQLRSRNNARRERNALDDRLDELELQSSESDKELKSLREKCDLLEAEVDGLVEETTTLGMILMQVMGQGMNKKGAERGHVPATIDQDTVDRFISGEDVDATIRKTTNVSPASPSSD
ncbi:hypothetical protein GGF46_003541 [Coemansia sp. RSA 552]|nr:hypothetical protein GGF46_003541 [Coemansia sp. RSA 552]